MTYIRLSPIYQSSQFSRAVLRPVSSQQHRFAHESYGGGQGNPKGETPQKQGSNPSAEKEHPGPSPPIEGQGTGGGPTKAPRAGQKTAEGFSGSSNDDGNKGNSLNGAQPKILNQNAPVEESEDVKRHNADYVKRHDRQGNINGDQADQKVDPKYWSGRSQLILAVFILFSYTN